MQTYFQANKSRSSHFFNSSFQLTRKRKTVSEDKLGASGPSNADNASKKLPEEISFKYSNGKTAS